MSPTNLGAMPSNAPVFGAFARADRTAGNLTLNSLTWADVDNALDLTLAAVVGDWIEVSLSGFWNNEAVVARMDAVSVVAGSPVNSWADQAAPDNTHFGVGGWFGPSGQQGNIGGSIIKQVVSGDLSGGNVTLRLRYRTSTAANKTLFAAAITPLTFWARNLRQP